MKKAKELYEAIKLIAGGKTDILPGFVTAVNDDNTIDVDYDGLTIPGCLLQSKTSGSNGFVYKPAIGSVVLLKRMNEQNDFFVCMYSAIDEYSFAIADIMFKLNQAGFLIKRQNDSLKDALTLIVEAIQNIYVVYGNNPDFVKLSQALDKINNILQ